MAKTQKYTDNRVNILGVGVTSTSMLTVLTKIADICREKAKARPFFLTTVNPEFVILAQSDPDFRDILNASDMAIPDGVGLRLAAPNLTEIIPGRKLVEAVATESKFRAKYKIFYLGGRGRVAHKMAEIYGGEWDAGEENIRAGERESKRIISKINKYEPDILFVAYGAPAQEKWIYANLDRIKARVVMGVGGSFDYLTGGAAAPPNWIGKIGLEWFWRLVHEPWRFKRQLALVKFVILVVFGPLGR